MKKIGLTLLSLSLIGGLLLGTSSNVLAQAKATLPTLISMGTNPVGSLYHAVGAGMANIISKFTPMRCAVEAYDGASIYVTQMKSGKLELGNMTTAELYFMYSGKYPTFVGIYKGKEPTGGYEIRSLAQITEFHTGNFAAGNSGIKTGYDFKGKRAALVHPSTQLGCYIGMYGYLDMFNLSEKDVIIVPVTGGAEGVRAIIEGRADFGNWSIGSSIIDELSIARGVRWISVDPAPEAVARFNKWYKMRPKLAKAGFAKGIVEDTWVQYSRQSLTCYESLPDNVAYAIVEALWNNTQSLQAVHPMLKTLTREKLCTLDATAPYHSGAIKFYKEKGVWTDKLEQLQRDLLVKSL